MEKQFLDLYKEAKQQIIDKSADIFNKGRDNAFKGLSESSFPTRKTEEYLYCPLFDALKIDWGINANRIKFGMNPDEMFHCAVPGIKANVTYMVNDVWAAPFDEFDLGNGAFICSIKHAEKNHADILNKYYNTILKDQKDSFVMLNSMLVQDGIFVYVPKGVECELPLQIVNIMHAGQDLMANNRNLFVLEENSSLQCIDCDHTLDNAKYFASRISEIYVGRNAQLNYCSIESTHCKMANLRRYNIKQEANSIVRLSTFGLTNGVTRNHIEVDLDDEGAEVWLGGMLLSDKEQKCENYTIIRHNKPNCKSEELYKYILDDKAEAGFSGRIYVAHGAQKTVSYQTNRNICLSEDAHAYGRPQLEIYADDVKCGHGATTGMLDPNALFYMQQRGIGIKEARLLLLQAFSAEVLEHIHITALNDRIRLLIEKRLHGDDMHCAGCNHKK